MKSRLENIWIADCHWREDTKEIRLDWSNDRHYAATIFPPCDNEKVADALLRLADILRRDRKYFE